ncbi:MAG TPA: hypothetical protein VI818_08755, partial [Candidatus Thermoplasmatota archaeon]|nr:hypothetical protein [Candidatus Thermoplasmatota archaeon]
FDWRSSDTLHLQDVRAWRIFWSRTINITRESNPTSGSQEEVNNITHLMGVANLAGDAEYEVVLLQPQFTTPRNQPNCNVNNPVDGSPVFRFATGGSVLALRGELRGGGADLWKQLIYDEGTLRVNIALEESFETVLLMWLQILGDMTQDKVPDIVVTFLAVEQSQFSPTTTNGRYRTHVVPLSGKDGHKLWRGEPKVQGWGFVADMNPDAATSVPYLALGTVDYPTAIPGGARFPPKDVRLAVYNVSDGTPRWSYREQFAQDSYLSYDMSLNQYLSSLAPHDWTGDGIKDLVTPSQYYPATGANQTLLAQATSRYQILDGNDGAVHAAVDAWGPSGVVMSCGPGVNAAGEPSLTVFSGHSRRYDISRFNITPSADAHWRFPLYNNPDLQSATLGTDIAFVGAECITTQDGRTVFALNMALASEKRGVEIMSAYGAIGIKPDDLKEEIQVLWIDPAVRGKPPASIDEILKHFEVEQTHPGLMLALTAGPAVPGLVAGLGLGRLRIRKGGPS